MRKLYLAFPKCGTLSHKLSWGHYYELLKIDDELERNFYIRECEQEQWNVRELKRQMKSMLFHRLALSRSKEEVLDEKWEAESSHRKQGMDVFRMTGHVCGHVCLKMTVLAKNLLLEEYPLAEKVLERKGNDWMLDADVKSNLNKAEMAKQLAHYIRFEGEFWIRRFPRREVRILHQLASLPKGAKANAGRQGYATILEMMGFIVGEQSESGDLLYRTTDEIHDALKRGLPNAEAAMYCMNYAKYERYLMGLTNLYGIVPYPMAYESIVAAAKFVEDEEFDRQRNPFAFLHESLLMDFYTISIGGQVYVVNPTADHPENVWQERQERDEFLEDYKKFTWQEIYDAGSEKDLPFVGENTPEGRGVSRVIAKLGITEDMADYMKYAFWRFGQEFQ